MKKGKLPELQKLLYARVGSARCGLLAEGSDRDIFILTPSMMEQLYDPEKDEAYFIWSVPAVKARWGHPLLLEDLTGECNGETQICDFLQEHRHGLYYAAPDQTAVFGLQHIAYGELSGFDSTIKLSLRIAMELSHMARGDSDPCTFSAEEKAILIRARTGGVPPEERADIYRRTISPENIDRLMKMPDHPAIKNELFQLIEDIISKEELPC